MTAADLAQGPSPAWPAIDATGKPLLTPVHVDRTAFLRSSMALHGEGWAWIEQDALMVQAWARTPRAVWMHRAFAVVFPSAWVVVGGYAWSRDFQLDSPPTWMTVFCWSWAAVTGLLRWQAGKLEELRVTRVGWNEIAEVAEGPLRFVLKTTSGKLTLAGHGPGSLPYLSALLQAIRGARR